MYLTRIPLDTMRRNTMRALANPNLFHGAVENAFEGERKRRLWRIDHLDGCCYLLLLSEERPDLLSFERQFGFLKQGQTWETKDYDRLFDKIEVGSQWHFRLTANPVIHKKTDRNRDRGKVLAHITVDYQKQWLLSRAKNKGFLLHEDDFTVTDRHWFHFNHGGKNQKIALLAVSYEGILQVTDTEKFIDTLKNGIGREKAYGMGLLTVAR